MLTQLSHLPSVSSYSPLPDLPTATSALALRRKSLKQLRLPSSNRNKATFIDKKQKAPESPTRTHHKVPLHHPSYKTGPVAILPHLYIGNEKNAHTLDQLNGIDCVLNVAAEVDQPSYKSIVPWLDKLKKPADLSKGYHKLATLQHGDELQIDEAIYLIDQAKKHRNVVLVHCKCGVARSATIVIGYVMHYLDLPLHAAYAFVQNRAPAIGPNLALLYQLQSLEKNHGLLASNQLPSIDNSSARTNINKKRKLDLIC